MRWNDIRIVGPTLVVVLLVLAMINPQIGPADHAVGNAGNNGECPDFGGPAFQPPGGSLIGNGSDCPTPDPCAPFGGNAGNAGGFLVGNGTDCPTPDPCAPFGGNAGNAGGFLVGVNPDCPTPVPSATVTPTPTPTATAVPAPAPPRPAFVFPPPAGPVVGPIFPGAIQASVDGSTVTLKLPLLLDVFIAPATIVEVTSVGTPPVRYYFGPTVRGALVFSAPGGVVEGPFLVKTTLVTGATYTELVTTVAVT